MLIGELSTKTGLSRDTIRFYEKSGLIGLDRKQRRENNYKEYPDQVLSRLLSVKSLKEFGFTLNEIKWLLKQWDSDSFDCRAEKYRVANKIAEIENQIRNLNEVKNRLLRSIARCPESCDIKDSLMRS